MITDEQGLERQRNPWADRAAELYEALGMLLTSAEKQEALVHAERVYYRIDASRTS